MGTIEADVTQIAADGAAEVALSSFGLGLAVFLPLEVEAVVQQGRVSTKAEELNNKLASADDDIAKKIGTQVSKYVTQFKANNKMIFLKAAKGLDTRTCRANLMHLMAGVEQNATLDVAHFRQYAGSCRLLFDSEEINKVYDALDKLNLSDAKDDAAVQRFMESLALIHFDHKAVEVVQSVCVSILITRIGLGMPQIARIAQAVGNRWEILRVDALDILVSVSSYAKLVGSIFDVVDMVFEIYSMVDVVQQCKTLCDKLDGPIKQSYKDYFGGIKEASIQCKASIAKKKASLAQ